MIELIVEGMTCNHCVKAVTQALSKVKGVERVSEVSLDRGRATVEGAPAVADLVEAVRDAGYEARAAS